MHTVNIDSGVLRVGSHTIFLKSVTSTRIEKLDSGTKFKGVGVLLLLAFSGAGIVALGTGLGATEGVNLGGVMLGILLFATAFGCLASFTYRDSTYVLVIETGAGETKLLTDPAPEPLREIEDALVSAITASSKSGSPQM